MNFKSILFQFLGIQKVSPEDLRQLLAIAEEQTYAQLDMLYDQLEKHYQNSLNNNEASYKQVELLKSEIESVNKNWEQLKCRCLPLIEQNTEIVFVH